MEEVSWFGLGSGSQYARGMATGVRGRRKSSSMCWRRLASESRDRTRVYWVWLKARSLVKD